jgi:beta-glucosidase
MPAAAAAQDAARPPAPPRASAQPTLGTRSAPVLTDGGLRFRDLNRNGALDRYEDWRLAPEARARDLVARMTLEEKAGAMMHGTARTAGPMGTAGVGAAYDTAANRALVDSAHVTSLITRLAGAPAELAEQNNALQAIAERTRLGVPVTVSTDPRHHFQYVLGATSRPGGFSQWPEPLGLAALGDAALVRRFGDAARREYRAVGLHMTLSPQADLATEPRWSRATGTFGEDADLAGRLVRAYVEGFQHGPRGVDAAGVLAVVKHWVGYGAAREGFDSHNSYGRFATFPGGSLDYHVRPFLGAFAAGVAGVMPTYSILQGATLGGRPVEPVGAGFNRQLVTDLLRTRYRFDGLVLTDWAVTNDCGPRCVQGAPAGERPSFADVAMPWGVEELPKPERFAKAVDAGVDQFGGTEDAGQLVAAVRAGRLREARLDTSVVRVVRQKFALGLFENPYVDAPAAARAVGAPALVAAGLDAQRRALVLLENRGALLPLRPAGRKVYLHRVDSAVAARYGWRVVSDPADADVAVVRMDAPFETLHPQYVFGAMQHEGDLGFRDGQRDYEALKRVPERVPVVATVYLDRPAVLTAVRGRVTRGGAGALVANFGVSDAALLDVLTGRARPAGRLPFELPSSMADVAAQRPDVPHDTRRPLYAFGAGRRY